MTNSVLRVVEHLERRGCQVLVVAPGIGPSKYSDTPVERIPAVSPPFYRSLSIGLPSRRLRRVLEDFSPDVVHLAAPVVLGAAAAWTARDLDIPSVAIFQTDLAGFAARYGWGFLSAATWRWLRWVHNRADLTLAPSSIATWTLKRHGIVPVARWARGVDLVRFNPSHRNRILRRQFSPNGEFVVGYVGRLAPEKQVHLLAPIQHLPGVRLVVVGDGPSATKLAATMPRATFVGFKGGTELAAHVASFDVFVHSGVDETFCQAIQEALASGVPVVAPAAGGPLDLVRHMDNGLLYPGDRPDLMVEAVRELAGDPGLHAALASRARPSVQGRSWEKVGDQLMEYYESVGAARRPRRAA